MARRRTPRLAPFSGRPRQFWSLQGPPTHKSDDRFLTDDHPTDPARIFSKNSSRGTLTATQHEVCLEPAPTCGRNRGVAHFLPSLAGHFFRVQGTARSCRKSSSCAHSELGKSGPLRVLIHASIRSSAAIRDTIAAAVWDAFLPQLSRYLWTTRGGKTERPPEGCHRSSFSFRASHPSGMASSISARAGSPIACLILRTS